MSSIIQKISNFIGKLLNSIGDFISRLVSAFKSVAFRKINLAQEELNIVSQHNDTLIKMPEMKPVSTSQKIIYTIVNTVEMGAIIYRFTNAMSNYLIRFATDVKTKDAVKKYIRMDRHERLGKMNYKLLTESFDKAGITVPDKAKDILSKVLVQLYDQVIDDYKPLYELMCELFEKLESTDQSLLLLECCERRCQDMHIALKLSRKNKVHIIRFGRATNLDLSTYATNKNFAKIAVISQLEFCNMFAVKSITTVDYTLKLITNHVEYTVSKTHMCGGVLTSLHNKIITNKQFLTQGNTYKTKLKEEHVMEENNKISKNLKIKPSRNLEIMYKDEKIKKYPNSIAPDIKFTKETMDMMKEAVYKNNVNINLTNGEERKVNDKDD